jgi:hypothetical protein
VTRKAANDLDDSALQLVLGHEIAYVAKRHTSKQTQQRLLDTGLAVEMLERILETRSTDGLDKVLGGGQVNSDFAAHLRNTIRDKNSRQTHAQYGVCSVPEPIH